MKQSYIVVGGGGGGTAGYGGGGGAGGFREDKSPVTGPQLPLDGTSITVPAQGFPIQVGGGGTMVPTSRNQGRKWNTL